MYIVEWSTKDVVDEYLEPINMEHMANVFLENNITGAVLLVLEVCLSDFLFQQVARLTRKNPHFLYSILIKMLSRLTMSYVLLMLAS